MATIATIDTIDMEIEEKRKALLITQKDLNDLLLRKFYITLDGISNLIDQLFTGGDPRPKLKELEVILSKLRRDASGLTTSEGKNCIVSLPQSILHGAEYVDGDNFYKLKFEQLAYVIIFYFGLQYEVRLSYFGYPEPKTTLELLMYSYEKNNTQPLNCFLLSMTCRICRCIGCSHSAFMFYYNLM